MRKVKEFYGVESTSTAELYLVGKNEVKKLREKNKRFEVLARTPKGCIINLEKDLKVV